MFGFKMPQFGPSAMADLSTQDKLSALGDILGEDQASLMKILQKARGMRADATNATAGSDVPQNPLTGIGGDLLARYGGVNLPAAPRTAIGQGFGFGFGRR